MEPLAVRVLLWVCDPRSTTCCSTCCAQQIALQTAWRFQVSFRSGGKAAGTVRVYSHVEGRHKTAQQHLRRVHA